VLTESKRKSARQPPQAYLLPRMSQICIRPLLGTKRFANVRHTCEHKYTTIKSFQGAMLELGRSGAFPGGLLSGIGAQLKDPRAQATLKVPIPGNATSRGYS
jgi:hypothetical protein